MLLRLLKQSLCLWVVFAIGMSGFDFCLYLSKMLPAASWFIIWAGGIASSAIGIIVGMASWKGFGLKE